MKTGVRALIMILPLVVFLPQASSQIYQWKDKAGNIHFSDTPPPAGSASEMKVKGGRESPGGPGGKVKAPGREWEGKRPYGEIDVVVYMAEWCPFCMKAREYLKSLGVNLIEHNVEFDGERRREMRSKGGNGIPLVDVEGIIIRGFNPDRIKAAVEKRRSSR